MSNYSGNPAFLSIKKEERYRKALKRIPAPGDGCHPSLLTVANLGVHAGLDGERIFRDIWECIPQGSRRVPDREITDAINKALSDHHGGTFTPRSRRAPIVHDGKSALQRIISQGKISEEAALRESSPIRLLGKPQDDFALFIETRFKPDDLIFIGDRCEAGIVFKTIRTASGWIAYSRNGGKTAPHIIINPLTGAPAPTKNGDKMTLRGDGNVAACRHCLAEFDNLSREEQIKFWSAAKLPIVALIDSGGKSIHAWLDVQKLAKVETPEQWQTQIKTRLYDRILKPLGVDGACSNPARLSRLPGHYRAEKGKYQRLLWLSPEGRPIS